jgi:hypothetical protein
MRVSAAGFSECFPLATRGPCHGLRRDAQPIRFPSLQVGQHAIDLSDATEVYVRRFRAHRMEERLFVTLFRKVCDFNGIRVG